MFSRGTEEHIRGKYGCRSWYNGTDYRQHQIRKAGSAASHGYGKQRPSEDEKYQDAIDAGWARIGGEELVDRVEYQMQLWDVMEAML